MAAKSNALRKESAKRQQPVAAPVASAAGAQKLDRIIHERLRLGILSALSVNESLTFSELKKLLTLPEAKREARLNSEEFKEKYSPAEQQVLSDLSRSLPQNYPLAGK